MTHALRLAAPFAFVVIEAPAEESDLVRRAQARDAAAFEQLYRAHVNRVYAICIRIAADVSRAEEFTQKTWIAAWQKLPLFRGECPFVAWLHRIAVNTALADLRADRRRERRVFSTEDPAVFESAPAPRPAGIRLDLEAAIAALPPQARAVFVLHDIEGWQHREIAGQLGVAVGTAKAQLHRARKLLQQTLR